MHVFTKKKKKKKKKVLVSNSLIKVISGLACRATFFTSLGQSHWFTDIRIFLYYFVKLNYLGFTNIDKTTTYLKSDKIQYTHLPVKNRPRPKGRHTIIAVRFNERNNRTYFAFSKAICKKQLP